MKKQSILLDGVWNARGIPTGNGKEINLDAVVPGHIHIDLEKEKIIEDPFWRDNADKCQWVEEYTWIFSRKFFYPESFSLDFCEIEFGGLDTYAKITVNGIKIGNTCNMFVPHTFSLKDVVHYGENNIEIIIKPYKDMIKGKRLDYMAAFNDSERLHVRRMQCTFYWDWVNRFVSAGIWRSVKIHSYAEARIEDLFVYTQYIGKTSAILGLELKLRKDNDKKSTAIIKIASQDNEIVWSEQVQSLNGIIYLQAGIENAKLWWPNGYGIPNLYSCIVTLQDDYGNILDSTQKSFGIRTVIIEQLKDRPGSKEYEKTLQLRELIDEREQNGVTCGESFTLIINGERIFCKGGNWVPADPFPSSITASHYEHLIKLAKEGNINLLRCWGGGIYEPEQFFDACDKYGIMISQDFLTACGHYPEDDEEFLQKIKEEIPKAICMLRNHPSLVWWTGDNENAMHYDFDSPNSPGKYIAENIIHPLLKVLDPSRPFMPTSPYGGRNNQSLTIGDSHYAAFLEADLNKCDFSDYIDRVKIVGRFMSESASTGLPNLKSLLQFMTFEDIKKRDMLEYHTKDNPHKPEGYPTLFRILELLAEKLFGKPQNIDDYINKLQYVQYEWNRVTMEAARRNKWYCSGLLYWMYNDCWPAIGWSIVDYYGVPKAGWYSIKRAAKGVIASIEKSGDDYYFYICNDILDDINVKANIYIQPFTGEKAWGSENIFTVAKNSSVNAITINQNEFADCFDENAVLVFEIEGDFGKDRAFYYSTMPYGINPPKVNLYIEKINSEKLGKIKIFAPSYARVVTLTGDAVFSDNYFDMLPNEEKIIEWYEYDNRNNEIEISCWNSK